MTRIVIVDTRGQFRFRLQTRRWGIWRTSYESGPFRTLTTLLAALSSVYAKATEAKSGVRFTRQQKRQAARMIAKVAR